MREKLTYGCNSCGEKERYSVNQMDYGMQLFYCECATCSYVGESAKTEEQAVSNFQHKRLSLELDHRTRTKLEGYLKQLISQLNEAPQEEAERWAERLSFLHTKYGADSSAADSADLLDCVEVEVKQVINRKDSLIKQMLEELKFILKVVISVKNIYWKLHDSMIARDKEHCGALNDLQFAENSAERAIKAARKELGE